MKPLASPVVVASLAAGAALGGYGLYEASKGPEPLWTKGEKVGAAVAAGAGGLALTFMAKSKVSEIGALSAFGLAAVLLANAYLQPNTNKKVS